MAVTVAQFRIDFPQFADDTAYPDSNIERSLTRSALRLDSTVWGSLYDEAQSYLAAHLLAVSGSANLTQGLIGQVTTITIPGEISVSGGSGSSGSSSGYSSTTYGQQFEELQKLIYGGVRII